MTTKKTLRHQLFSYRNTLSEAAFQKINQAIMGRLIALPEIQKATYIHCYWPIRKKRELDTTTLIEQLRSERKKIFLPVVVSFNNTNNPEPRMEHRMYKGETNLITNRWGIQEPAAKTTFSTNLLQAIIVPALGVDRNGFRLGYGKGFYDEFLAQCDCPFICPMYSKGLLNEIPTMPHDIPVDIIVTEQEVIRLKP